MARHLTHMLYFHLPIAHENILLHACEIFTLTRNGYQIIISMSFKHDFIIKCFPEFLLNCLTS